jgi:hypothetical protein
MMYGLLTGPKALRTEAYRRMSLSKVDLRYFITVTES